ncbi:hypothetical protein [Rickettsia endosymbiont of Halotydeus destructor]|uniref:hypothetical protein n=1 Tax=Rickettsia endosymbiont of Halotydeus destructor TaxID=2996754 RepID=UPI003BB13824
MKKQKAAPVTTTLPANSAKTIMQEIENIYAENINEPLRKSYGKPLEVLKVDMEILSKLAADLKCAIIDHGQGKACLYLANFHWNGWLFEKNATNGDIVLTIGKKLGSIDCITVNCRDQDFNIENEKLAVAIHLGIIGNKKQHSTDKQINSIIHEEIEANNLKILDSNKKDIVALFDPPSNTSNFNSLYTAPFADLNIEVSKYEENQKVDLMGDKCVVCLVL